MHLCILDASLSRYAPKPSLHPIFSLENGFYSCILDAKVCRYEPKLCFAAYILLLKEEFVRCLNFLISKNRRACTGDGIKFYLKISKNSCFIFASRVCIMVLVLCQQPTKATFQNGFGIF